MLRSSLHRNPATAIYELQESFRFSDHDLAMRFNVPVETVHGWRVGNEYPSNLALKQMSELLQLDEALTNARSGKYRQA